MNVSHSHDDNGQFNRRATEAAVASGEKAHYSAPQLTFFGTVRALTAGNATVGTDTTNTRRNPQSDRATKQDIVRVGTHPLGFGLYLFSYKPEFRDRCGSGRQFGVMADEVEGIMPAAVSTGPGGYRQVDYSLLGIL